MRAVIVQYKIKPDRVSENIKYVEKVFEQLKSEQPSGLQYGTSRKNDDVSFLHFAVSKDENTPLAELSAFQEFLNTIKDRCEEQPVITHLHPLGSYRLFGNGIAED